MNLQEKYHRLVIKALALKQQNKLLQEKNRKLEEQHRRICDQIRRWSK